MQAIFSIKGLKQPRITSKNDTIIKIGLVFKEEKHGLHFIK